MTKENSTKPAFVSKGADEEMDSSSLLVWELSALPPRAAAFHHWNNRKPGG